MLQFILGRAGSGKTAEVFSRVAAALKDGKSPVLLVPEQFSFETERAAALRFGMKEDVYKRQPFCNRDHSS